MDDHQVLAIEANFRNIFSSGASRNNRGGRHGSFNFAGGVFTAQSSPGVLRASDGRIVMTEDV